MEQLPVIAILDIGKTNKKVVVFDSYYNIIAEESIHLEESVDEDGDPCENIHLLTEWIRSSFDRIMATKEWDVRAINVSAYGASLVHIGSDGKPVSPLYNYLKPFPEFLATTFHSIYPGVPTATASPDLGNLNSGMQLYMVKQTKPAIFNRIATSLHLPQYAAFVLNGRQHSDLTSLGCHTFLWDFRTSHYHSWVSAEGLSSLMAPIAPSDKTVEIFRGKKIIYSGIGLHDSSAALIPYLLTTSEPFCLISTGTWCITLNPFNPEPLTDSELARDCLCYLSYQGRPVKAARLFAGHFHDEQVKVIAGFFSPEAGGNFHKEITVRRASPFLGKHALRDIEIPFEPFDPGQFQNSDAAYVYLIEELVARQVQSTQLVLGSDIIKNIYVDGGFSMNSLFMYLLSKALPGYAISGATVAQASALGAALVIHDAWNKIPVNPDILKLKAAGQ